MKILRVAAAVLPHPHEVDQVLIGQRRSDDTSAFKWEFPGGKLQEDETYDTAVVREIEEELDLKIEFVRNLHRVEYTYSDELLVKIEFLLCRFLDSFEAKTRVHEEVRWVKVDDLAGYDFLAANLPFVGALISREVSLKI